MVALSIERAALQGVVSNVTISIIIKKKSIKFTVACNKTNDRLIGTA